jgi:hypothetical protein
MMKRWTMALTALLAMMVGLSACGGDRSGGTGTGLPLGDDPVDLNPSEFSVEIDNPYWPMEPGTQWT